MSRLADVIRFYALIDNLAQRLGGSRSLAELGMPRLWPRRGVYFFFEPGESRAESGGGSRIVRVGTHGLGVGSRSTLHQRLRQHGGQRDGGGNHRGSIFRLLVGQALMASGALPHCASWGVKGEAAQAAASLGLDRNELRQNEASAELAVSRYLATMSFVFQPIDDEPGPESLRGLIGRQSIALLSNFERDGLDLPSAGWLGHA